MQTQYAVMHSEKGKGTGGALGNHIDREPGKEYSYPHADPDRSDLNRHMEVNKYCSMPLEEAISQRLLDGYSSKKAIRKDAVKYMTTIFTGTHERMKEIGEDLELLTEWLAANLLFAVKEFGSENIIRFTLHMDEKTPHIHCVTVPLTADGRLSAKEVMGNMKDLQERQDRYAQAMEPFGLVRGVRGTKKAHDDLYAYHGRISQLEAQTEATKPKEYSRLNAMANTAEINQQLATLHALALASKVEKEKLERRVKDLERANKDKELEIAKLDQGHRQVIQDKFKALRNFGYTRELIAKLQMGHQLRPEEREFIDKSVAMYRDKINQDAQREQQAKQQDRGQQGGMKL